MGSAPEPGNQMSRARRARDLAAPCCGERWSRLLSVLSRRAIDVPLVGNAFELVLAAILEADARAGDQVFDGAGDEHLAGVCERGDASTNVHGQPADVIAVELAFAGMDGGAHFEAEPAYLLGDRGGASDRPRWPVEGGQEAVPGRVDSSPRYRASCARTRLL